MEPNSDVPGPLDSATNTDTPTLTRRSLLVAAGLAAFRDPMAASASGAPIRATIRNASTRRSTVVVIGAGMAGLTAAQLLRAEGRDVVVLEARSRLGGRIHTDRGWPGVPLDLGASWIHGVRTNPLAALAIEAGATTTPTSYDSSRTHVAPGLRAQGFTESDTARWESVVEDALDWAASQRTDVSLSEAVRRVSSGMSLSPVERIDLEFHLGSTFTAEWGADPERLSAKTVEAGKEFDDSGEDALFPRGYDRLVDHLATGLTIRRAVVVRKVTARASSVRLETSAGPIDADAAVVTVPLGVLKSGAIVFDPVLPDAKRRAIEVLEMGVLAKTFLRFDRVFWPRDVDWHEFIGTPSGRWSQWVSFAKVGAPVLLGFNAGSRGREIEAMPEHAVIADATVVLRQMFGGRVPKPVATKTSSWSVDPYALGSYSANTLGSTRADRVALGAPFGRVFFAGEATEPDYASTVHGARFSAQRVVRELERALR